MSDSDTKTAHNEPGDGASTQTPAEEPPRASEQATPEQAADPSDSAQLQAKLEQAQAEALKVRDQLLRTAADFDNYRKRARKDVEDALRKGLEKALLEVLPVSDNLERAVAAAKQAGDLASVVEGVSMVLSFFEDALTRLGVQRVPSVGHPFDPAIHEAVQQVESDENAGQVVSELTPGYKLGDKLLRAAMVVVARPQSTKQAESSDSGAPEG